MRWKNHLDGLRMEDLDNLFDDAWIFESGGVLLDLSAFCDGAKDAAHDFAATCFWQSRYEGDLVALGQRSDIFGDDVVDLFDQLHLVCRTFVVFEHYKSEDALTFDLVRFAHHGAFGDSRVMADSRFDLGGTESVAADVDHVIHAARDPDVAIFVVNRSVAAEVDGLAVFFCRYQNNS